MRPHKAFGVNFEEAEVITSNNQFFSDGSGAFRSLNNALKHYDKLLKKFVSPFTVQAESPSDTPVIAECQTDGDNAPQSQST
jgi:hypothetical protein